MQGPYERIIAGLDIGTTKVCAMIAKVTDGDIEIIGIGQSPSFGVRNGLVINIEETANAIRTACNEAELMAGCELKSAVVGIADRFINSQDSVGIVSVKRRAVLEEDIRRAIDSAKSIRLSDDREIIHVIPREFVVDSLEGIQQPLSMNAARLEVRAHIVTAASTSVRNIMTACSRAGIQVSDIVLQSLASSRAVITDDERDFGVALVDIGGGTTDVAVFKDGGIWHTAEIPCGGRHLTSDLATGLQLSMQEAEQLKLNHGACFIDSRERDVSLEIGQKEHGRIRTTTRREISGIIRCRTEEILGLVAAEVRRSKHEGNLLGGVVLTGGSSQLAGIQLLAEQIFGCMVRTGIPDKGISGMGELVGTPSHATAVGLLLHDLKQNPHQEQLHVTRSTSVVAQLWTHVSKIVREIF